MRNSSYIFQWISTKLSHNYCNQVPQRILSGFFDSIIFHGIMALCFFCTYVIYREYFFCAQLLLHFSMDWTKHIYAYPSWWDRLNVTSSVSPGVRPHPLNFTYVVRSQKPFRSPPLNHIYSYSSWCNRLNGTTVTSLGVTQGSGPAPTILLMTLYFKNHTDPHP